MGEAADRVGDDAVDDLDDVDDCGIKGSLLKLRKSSMDKLWGKG